MKLDRKQRTALGVLALVTAALVADRAVLSPQSAAASVTDASAPNSAVMPEVKSGVSPENMSANLRVVSLRVEAPSTERGPVDPFAWQLPQTERVAQATARSFEDVVSGWAVSSIVGSAESRLAVINRRAVRVNESLAFSATDPRQAKVVEIREGSVVLYHGGKTVTAFLPTTTLSGVD
ncbi:MAG: hypothetical protein ACI89L_000228 [Phycisphaerales bacterium]